MATPPQTLLNWQPQALAPRAPLPPAYTAAIPLSAVFQAKSTHKPAATQYKEQGNTLFKANRLVEAAQFYLQAILADPTYTDAYFNLGKTHLLLNDYAGGAQCFQRLLALDPSDHEARVYLAKSWEWLGQAWPALIEYRAVLKDQPNYDPAYRRVQLLQARLGSPQDHGRRIQDVAGHGNLIQAKALLTQYLDTAQDPSLTPEHRKKLKTLMDTVPIFFDTTQTLGGSTNMGEYIHLGEGMRSIRLKSELAFAHPSVVGAYLMHELIHSNDNDPISSVREEQDCYLASTRFWQQTRGDLIEPNLDLALNLLEQSPQALSNRVAELYLSRNKAMPMVSPGHGANAGGFEMGFNGFNADAEIRAIRFGHGSTPVLG
ncbi:MAG: tetratricopeptide repeat protein [Vampirovibrionales bacterium]|nr:tetratricopeptide repeat protein [Vampirovibrionales bacterium]